MLSNPNRPWLGRRTIVIQPVGAFEPGLSPRMEILEQYVAAFFRLPVRVAETAPVGAMDGGARTHPRTGRRQLLTTDVLTWLADRLPSDAYCVLAVTMEDLYPDPKWNFVFGQATLEDRVGVFSFARADPAFPRSEPGSLPLIERRSVQTMAHEIGHMFGITHCTHFRCVMNGSNSLEESDRTPHHLCPVCLRKLHAAVQFDPVERYHALLEVYRAMDARRAAAWIERRLTP